LRIIKEMFEASVDGQPYDTGRWGQYYRPYGLEVSAGSTAEKQSAPASVASAPATAPVADDEPDEGTNNSPIVVPKTAPSSDKAQDILAMIRARQNKSA